MLENVINDIFEVLIIVSTSIVAIYLFIPLINKKYEVKWRKWIWILLAIRLLIPYNFSISTTPIRLITDLGASQEVSEVVNPISEPNIIVENNADASELTQQSQAEGLKTSVVEKESILMKIWNADIYVKLLFIWALGMIMAVSIHLVLYFIFRRNCISNCEDIEDINILRCIEKAKRTCNISKQIPVYFCLTISSPMMMGIFKTILLIPKEKYEENELQVILNHECTHYQSKDLWYKAFMTLVSDIYWFNPIILLMKRQAFKDLELVCDRSVVKGMDKEERALYSNALVHVGRRGAKEITYSTCFTSNKKIIKERIEGVFDMSKKKNGKKFLILLVTVFTVGSLFVACGTESEILSNGADEIEVIQEETKPEVVEEQIKPEVTQEKAKPKVTKNNSKRQVLSQTELNFFTSYFMDLSNNGFLLSNYGDPTQINVVNVFYNGAGIYHGNEIGDAERKAYLNISGRDDIHLDLVRLTTKQMDGLLEKKAGVKLSEITNKLPWYYLKEYDTYYFEHGDTNLCMLTCVSGYKTSEGSYVIECSSSKNAGLQAVNNCEVTLKKEGDSYKFQSNIIK